MDTDVIFLATAWAVFTQLIFGALSFRSNLFVFTCRTSFQLSKLESTICDARNLCYWFRNALAVSRFGNNILALGPTEVS